MLTRESSQRLRAIPIPARLGHWVAASILGVLLLAGCGMIERAWSAPGGGDPFEYRIPEPGSGADGHANRQGDLGNPDGNTDADPDEFSVNNVGIHRPDVAYQPIGSGGSSHEGGWLAHLHYSMLMLLRIWLTLGVGR